MNLYDTGQAAQVGDTIRFRDTPDAIAYGVDGCCARVHYIDGSGMYVTIAGYNYGQRWNPLSVDLVGRTPTRSV
jgi:hypothetical protein